MKKQKISDAMGKINTTYINEATSYNGESATVRRRAWAKWTAAAACVCAVLAATTFGLPKIIPHGDVDMSSDGGASKLWVNKATVTGLGDIDAQDTFYHNLTDAEQQIMLGEFEAAFKMSLDGLTEKMPKDFTLQRFYSLDTRHDISSMEYTPYQYTAEYGSENGSRIDVTLCAEGKPLTDCIFVIDNPTPSVINGTSVVICGFNSDVYEVTFCREGIYYKVEASGITLEELESVLTGILS